MEDARAPRYVVTGYDPQRNKVPILGRHLTQIRSSDWSYMSRVMRAALERGVFVVEIAPEVESVGHGRPEEDAACST